MVGGLHFFGGSMSTDKSWFADIVDGITYLILAIWEFIKGGE